MLSGFYCEHPKMCWSFCHVVTRQEISKRPCPVVFRLQALDCCNEYLHHSFNLKIKAKLVSLRFPNAMPKGVAVISSYDVNALLNLTFMLDNFL